MLIIEASLTIENRTPLELNGNFTLPGEFPVSNSAGQGIPTSSPLTAMLKLDEMSKNSVSFWFNFELLSRKEYWLLMWRIGKGGGSFLSHHPGFRKQVKR